MDWQTFGHESEKNILNKQIAAGKFPHAYLFSGPEGLGKKTLALELARKILNAQRLDNHPDFQILDGGREITMEQVQGFIASLGFKPFLGAKKVAIINNAENLNQTASNALLKTLEEPSASTIIILISGGGRLLPTIISRCQVFNFNSFSQSLLKQFSEKENLKVSDEIINLSFGSVARLKRLSEDKEFLESQLEVIGEYKNLQKMPLAQKLASISNLADAEDLEARFKTWVFWQSAALAQKPGEFLKVRALMAGLTSLEKNQNKKLILQGLMLKI